MTGTGDDTSLEGTAEVSDPARPAASLPGVAIDDATLADVVGEAKRAPSPHNTQPARWRVRGDVIELLEEPSRRLLASDPTGRDHRIALGAAWEGTRLALGKRGLRLTEEVGAFVPDAGVVVRGRVVRAQAPASAGKHDPLADVVGMRATWRHRFAPIDDDALVQRVERRLGREGALLSTNKAIIDEAARTIDAAQVRLLLAPRCLEELVDWTRFTRAHPSYERDGLNLEALRLSQTGGAVARLLLRRRSFDALARAGVARWLVSEAAPTSSSSALIAITAPVDEPDLVTGGHFYRAWLIVTHAGLALCPMSALTDDEELRKRFARAFEIASDRRLVGVWRVGRVPSGMVLSPRLPTAELIAKG